MEDLKERLKEQLRETDILISRIEKSLSGNRNLPDCRINVSRKKEHDQYFWEDRKTGKRRFVRAAEEDILRKTAQRDYEINVYKKLKQARIRLGKFLSRYDPEEISRVYSRMADSRKRLVVPVLEPDDSFIEKWRSVPYEPMPFDSDTSFYSECGIRVRSKSELLIADMLERKGIPFRYEFPLYLEGVGNVRPDFMCLNTRTRREFIWEHFGMMDNFSYANRAIAKIRNYQQNGYAPGKNFIMTFESSQMPVSSLIIKKTIEEYLS